MREKEEGGKTSIYSLTSGTKKKKNDFSPVSVQEGPERRGGLPYFYYFPGGGKKEKKRALGG